MCAFSYSTNCKEVNHDKSFINDSLQTFPGLILFFLPWIRLPFPDFLIVTLNNSSRSTCNLKYDEHIYLGLQLQPSQPPPVAVTVAVCRQRQWRSAIFISAEGVEHRESVSTLR